MVEFSASCFFLGVYALGFDERVEKKCKENERKRKENTIVAVETFFLEKILLLFINFSK